MAHQALRQRSRRGLRGGSWQRAWASAALLTLVAGELAACEKKPAPQQVQRAVQLTALTLAAAPGRVFSRDDLLGAVWDIHGNVNTRTVDVHVRRLRQSLGAAADWVETVHGFGYRARKDEPDA